MNGEGRHKLEHNCAWRSHERKIERRSEVSLCSAEAQRVFFRVCRHRVTGDGGKRVSKFSA